MIEGVEKGGLVKKQRVPTIAMSSAGDTRRVALIATLMALLALAAMLAVPGPALAAMYKWVDDKGVIHYTDTLPRTIRVLLYTVGALKKSGSNLVSYLLFEKEYCRALIKLGYNDSMQRRDELMKFLGYEACWL